MALKLSALLERLGLSGRSVFWKSIAIIFALLNLKSLPFGWHIRLFTGLLAHLRSSRVRLASNVGPAALFQPIITSSRSGFLECDYNLHKSNSTYFSDFDVGRLQLLVSSCTHGMERTRKELSKEKGVFTIMLGGVSCNFRREIKPYEGFEIWSRILTWDDKWIYVVGHFVKKGTVKPRGYTLQPWRKTGRQAEIDKIESNGTTVNGEASTPKAHPAIYASAIAKYVWKKGRLTIPPERVLRASELLPPRPIDSETHSTSLAPAAQGTSIDAAATSAPGSLSSDTAGEVLPASLAASFTADRWDWERIEKERQRGLGIAQLWNGLDALNDEFTGEEKPALGYYF